MSVVAVPLMDRKGTQVAQALIDEQDAPKVIGHVWRLHKSGRGYAVRRQNGQVFLLHRHILGIPLNGRAIEVDHINHDPLDNRRTNLRVVTHAQNHQNRLPSRTSTSNYRGVHWYNRKRCWIAKAKINGKAYHIGCYKDECEAAEAAASWRLQHMPFAVE